MYHNICETSNPQHPTTRILQAESFFSWKRKELPEICWCQNDRIFKGLSDFQKNLIFEFLEFWISVFLYYFWISGHILGTKRATGDPLVSKRPYFSGLFKFSGLLYIFWISCYISGTKRAMGDPLVSKRLHFLISVFFLDFWPYLGNEKSYGRFAGVKTTGFLGAFQIFKKK